MDAAASPPPLPWHYLAGIVTLINGRTVGGRNLIKELIALPPAELLKALPKDQAGDAPGGLFSHVKAISKDTSKEQYTWTTPWPPTLNISLREGLADVVIGPSEVAIPWPFPADKPAPGSTIPELKEKLQKAQDHARLPRIPPHAGLNPAKELHIDKFMRAADAAVKPNSATRHDFDKIRGNCDEEKLWLERHTGIKLPDDLTVCAEERLESYKTMWEVRDGKLHLRLGWLEAATSCPPVGFFGWLKQLIRALLALLGLLGPRFDTWPSGHVCR
jgi:hypothetical protein